MSKQQYQDMRFSAERAATIKQINAIVTEYTRAGYRLTSRQIYYQFVARDLFPAARRWTWTGSKWERDEDNGTINAEPNYKWLCGLINDAKMAGLTDWDALEDRTREFIKRPRWESGKDILESIVPQFHMDMWVNQPRRAFVIVEKEALAGVLERVCREYDVPLLAARGYPSGSVLREFTVSDLLPCWDRKRNTWAQEPFLLHLGDHDPSGIDMSRDLSNRIRTFISGEHKPDHLLPEQMFVRVALNMDQIEDQQPPPNPAKTTDARFKAYAAEHGDESWELDALRPQFLHQLVEDQIEGVIERDSWDERAAEIEDARERLRQVAEDFGS